MSPFHSLKERALGRPALVARVEIHGTPALRRPAHDLDLALRRVVNEIPVAFERLRRRVDDGHPHATELGGKIRIEVVDRGRHRDPADYPTQL
jgi:hypothetical protein